MQTRIPFSSFGREDNLYFGTLRQAQLIALATIAAAVPLTLWLSRRAQLELAQELGR